MALRPSITVVILILGLSSAQTFAQQALVRSYTNSAQSIGQAYLTHYGDRCIALLPEHVATEAGVPAFLREGSKLLGESEDLSDLGDDLALAQVMGSVTQNCGFSISTISRATSNLISQQGIATLRSVNSDGTIAQMAVSIVDDDGEMFLRVRPVNDKIQIRKGHSGSLVMVGDQPVGILLSVSSRHGVGKVLRMDIALARAEEHMARKSAMAGHNEPDSTPENEIIDLAAAVNGGRVTGWNTLPLDAEHRPANLIQDDSVPPWRAQVESWPVEVELDLAGDKVVISRIELDARDVGQIDELPGKVEVLVNIGTDKKRWRSLLSREVEYGEGGIAALSFAPTWARQVKLVIGDSGEGNTVSLRRIRISNP